MGPENRPRFLQLLLLCPREIGEPFGVEGGGDRGLPLEHLVDEVLAVRAVLLLRFRPLFYTKVQLLSCIFDKFEKGFREKLKLLLNSNSASI